MNQARQTEDRQQQGSVGATSPASGRSQLFAALALLLVAVVVFWPRVDRPDWQGTEGRRVQIGHEMSLSSDWVVPRINGEPTLTKPPLFYWVLSTSESLFGLGRHAARWPSVVSLWLFACVAFGALRRHFGASAGYLGAVGALTLPTITYHGGFAEIDAMFAALSAWSLVWLGLGLASRSRLRIVAAGLVGSLALLTKGPPYFLFFAGALLVWGRHRRFFALHWFLPALLVPVFVWVWLLAGRVGGLQELLDIWKSETVGRSAGFGLEHLLLAVPFVLGAFGQVLPLGLWTFWEPRGAREARLQDHEILLRVCSAAAVSGVLLLILSTGRSARYLLPGVLTFAVAVAPAVAAYARLQRAPTNWQLGIPRFAALLGAVALFALPWLNSPLPGRSFWWVLVVALLGLAIHSRRQIVLYALLVPALLPWTVLEDRVERASRGYRSAAAEAAVLRSAIDQLGIADDLQFFGHVPNDVMLHAGLLDVEGDEFRARTLSMPWVLHESHPDDAGSELDAYRPRVRIRGHGHTLVLSERVDR